MDFIDLSMQCAPTIHVQTMSALVKTESGFNPYAIGVVRGQLVRQPRNLDEAIATAESLDRKGYNFSVGYAQVNKHNFYKYGLNSKTAFEPCANLRAGAEILQGCFLTAKSSFGSEQAALRAALSCYYSGNFQTGFKPDFRGQPSYVEKVVGNAIGAPYREIQVLKVRAARKAGRASSSSYGQATQEANAQISAMVF